MRSQLAWAFGLQRGNSSPGGGFDEVPGEWKCPPPGGRPGDAQAQGLFHAAHTLSHFPWHGAWLFLG